MFPSTTPESDNVNIQFNTVSSPKAITAPAHAEPSKQISVWRRVLAYLWKFVRFDVESMYKRDERDMPSPDPSKPTSLNEKLVADIWMLNSKH